MKRAFVLVVERLLEQMLFFNWAFCLFNQVNLLEKVTYFSLLLHKID